MAILAGLVSRSRTGVGRRVEVDLLSAGIDLQAESLSYYLNGAKPGTIASQGPTAGWHNSVPYGIYATASGHLVISLASAEKSFCPESLNYNFTLNITQFLKK